MGVSAPLVINEEGSCLSSSSNKQNDYTWWQNLVLAQRDLNVGAVAYYWLSDSGLGGVYSGETMLSNGYSPNAMGTSFINAYNGSPTATVAPTPVPTATPAPIPVLHLHQNRLQKQHQNRRQYQHQRHRKIQYQLYLTNTIRPNGSSTNNDSYPNASSNGDTGTDTTTHRTP